jgi:hypothetical protein
MRFLRCCYSVLNLEPRRTQRAQRKSNPFKTSSLCSLCSVVQVTCASLPPPQPSPASQGREQTRTACKFRGPLPNPPRFAWEEACLYLSSLLFSVSSVFSVPLCWV